MVLWVDLAPRPRGERLAIGAFGRNALRGRRGKRLVQLDQRFALKRVGVAARLLAVRTRPVLMIPCACA